MRRVQYKNPAAVAASAGGDMELDPARHRRLPPQVMVVVQSQ